MQYDCWTLADHAQSTREEDTCPIDGIQECVKCTLRWILDRVIDVICLVQHQLLRIEQRIRQFKVQSRLSAAFGDIDRCLSSINKVRRRMSSLRDVWSILLEEKVEIFLIVEIAFFKNSYGVAWISFRGRWNIVECLDACWCDQLITMGEGGQIWKIWYRFW